MLLLLLLLLHLAFFVGIFPINASNELLGSLAPRSSAGAATKAELIVTRPVVKTAVTTATSTRASMVFMVFAPLSREDLDLTGHSHKPGVEREGQGTRTTQAWRGRGVSRRNH